MKNIGSMIFQNFEDVDIFRFFFEKLRILKICFKNDRKPKNYRRNVKRIKGQSTSPPSGNLVDGLPLVCSTRAVVYEIKMGVPKNGTPPPENGRVADVLLDDLEQ